MLIFRRATHTVTFSIQHVVWVRFLSLERETKALTKRERERAMKDWQ